jgi:hypothetical protein
MEHPRRSWDSPRGTHGIVLRCTTTAIANQGLVSHHFREVHGRVERVSIPFRYAWPAELDLMAEIAGMRLRDRWSDWNREPFTSDSPKHVSVWERPRQP